jgi:pimeloyl-ACP methyl ester carboxylesterase
MSWFDGFESRSFEVNGASINARVSKTTLGEPQRPALLLLHGFPQSHVMWHRVAQRLAGDYFLVMPDLRGYGDSSKTAGLPDHSNYSKRNMAHDMAGVMDALGVQPFFPVRPRPRRARGAPAGAGPRRACAKALRHRHRAHAGHVRGPQHDRALHGVCPRLLPLVPHAAAGAAARDHDGRQPPRNRQGLFARQAGRLGQRGHELHRAAGAGRIRAQLLQCRGAARRLRGLPRQRRHRPGARPRQPRATPETGLRPAGAVGRARCGAPHVRPAGAVAGPVQRRSHRPGHAGRAFHSRRAARGHGAGAARIFFN